MKHSARGADVLSCLVRFACDVDKVYLVVGGTINRIKVNLIRQWVGPLTVTYHCRNEGWLKAALLKFAPVNVVEERMRLNFVAVSVNTQSLLLVLLKKATEEAARRR